MSIRIMAKVWDIDLGNPIRKLIMLKLADNANDHGVCWPSVEGIARHCDCSERSVKSHISELKNMGLLEIKRQFNQSNYYTITLGAGDAPLKQGQEMPRRWAGDAPEQGQEIPKQGQEMPTNHKEPSIKPSKNHHNGFDDALDHLLNVTGRKFRTSPELNARLKDYSLDEVKQVIDYKARQWMGTDMQTYLRPQTLFNANKFESYLNDSMQNVKTIKTNNQSSSIDVLKSIELVNTAGMLTHD